MCYVFITLPEINIKVLININKGRKFGYESIIILTHMQINQTIITNEATGMIIIKNKKC